MEPHDNPPPAPEPAPSDSGSAASDPTSTGELSKDDLNMAMLAHLLGAFTSFLGPLIIWLVRKEDSDFVEAESREALNFQITLAIGFFMLFAAACFTFGLSTLLAPLLWIYMLVFSILGALKAKDGTPFRYPATIRLVK